MFKLQATNGQQMRVMKHCMCHWLGMLGGFFKLFILIYTWWMFLELTDFPKQRESPAVIRA